MYKWHLSTFKPSPLIRPHPRPRWLRRISPVPWRWGAPFQPPGCRAGPPPPPAPQPRRPWPWLPPGPRAAPPRWRTWPGPVFDVFLISILCRFPQNMCMNLVASKNGKCVWCVFVDPALRNISPELKKTTSKHAGSSSSQRWNPGTRVPLPGSAPFWFPNGPALAQLPPAATRLRPPRQGRLPCPVLHSEVDTEHVKNMYGNGHRMSERSVNRSRLLDIFDENLRSIDMCVCALMCQHVGGLWAHKMSYPRSLHASRAATKTICSSWMDTSPSKATPKAAAAVNSWDKDDLQSVNNRNNQK